MQARTGLNCQRGIHFLIRDGIKSWMDGIVKFLISTCGREFKRRLLREFKKRQFLK